jgi:hypothetical protein
MTSNLSFGRVGQDQQIVLVDEISGGYLRAFKVGDTFSRSNWKK